MNIHIPDWLVLLTFYSLLYSAVLFCLLMLWVRCIQRIVWIFKQRKVYAAVLVWITLKKYRDRAEKWNAYMLEQLAEKTRIESPSKLRSYANVFNWQVEKLEKSEGK